VEIRTNNRYYLKVDRKRSSGRPSVQKKRENESDVHDALYCKVCGKCITAKAQAITVNSSFRHTFFNPAGIVFELGCYKKAPGCKISGMPSSEFSWFSGYLWRFALCGGCEAHLGWCFESGTSAFWGLILNKLKE
jgi:hypothetical protein